ncbi:hypothetical protein EON65_11825 [archaeon]|nr:MAG: hypothetical protein EON65_11825 [archaeon]
MNSKSEKRREFDELMREGRLEAIMSKLHIQLVWSIVHVACTLYAYSMNIHIHIHTTLMQTTLTSEHEGLVRKVHSMDKKQKETEEQVRDHTHLNHLCIPPPYSPTHILTYP